jgi:hypothetical protein
MFSSPRDISQGIHIPAYATSNASNSGSNKQTKAFESWKVSSDLMSGGMEDGAKEAWNYVKSLSPNP